MAAHPPQQQQYSIPWAPQPPSGEQNAAYMVAPAAPNVYHQFQFPSFPVVPFVPNGHPAAAQEQLQHRALAAAGRGSATPKKIMPYEVFGRGLCDKVIMEAEIEDKKHTVVIDEPLEFGGSNMGQSPFHLILSALAACFQVTSMGMSKQLGCELSNMRIKVTGDAVFDGVEYLLGKRGADNTVISYQQVHIDYTVETDATEEILEAVMEKVEESCPILNMLTRGGTHVNITWHAEPISGRSLEQHSTFDNDDLLVRTEQSSWAAMTLNNDEDQYTDNVEASKPTPAKAEPASSQDEHPQKLYSELSQRGDGAAASPRLPHPSPVRPGGISVDPSMMKKRHLPLIVTDCKRRKHEHNHHDPYAPKMVGEGFCFESSSKRRCRLVKPLPQINRHSNGSRYFRQMKIDICVEYEEFDSESVGLDPPELELRLSKNVKGKSVKGESWKHRTAKFRRKELVGTSKWLYEGDLYDLFDKEFARIKQGNHFQLSVVKDGKTLDEALDFCIHAYARQARKALKEKNIELSKDRDDLQRRNKQLEGIIQQEQLRRSVVFLPQAAHIPNAYPPRTAAMMPDC